MKQNPTTPRLLAAILAWSALLAPAPDAAAGGVAADPARPDIVLVMVDSLRADHLGCYGYARDTTPFLDGFAREAVLFRRAFAMSSWTLPSITGVFTSSTPDRHLNFRWDMPYSTNVATLAETLRSAGYQTVGITCNPMTSRKYGFHRGFDVYDDFSISLPPGSAAADTAAQAGTGAAMTRLAQNWLFSRRDKTRPIFLFLLYMDPHWDYLPPHPYGSLFTDDPVPPPADSWKLAAADASPAVRRRTLAAYDGEIRYTDSCISNLVASILASPRSGDTLLAVCSDHGEAFWERGLAGHGNNLHDEEIHVPLIVRPPAGAMQVPEGGGIVDEQVGLIDLGKTLLDFAGVPPPGRWTQGASLRPLLAGGTRPSEIPVVLDLRIAKSGVLRGVRTSGFKLVSDLSGVPIEAYALRSDPGETNNLAKAGAVLPEEALALIPYLKPFAEGDPE